MRNGLTVQGMFRGPRGRKKSPSRAGPRYCVSAIRGPVAAPSLSGDDRGPRRFDQAASILGEDYDCTKPGPAG